MRPKRDRAAKKLDPSKRFDPCATTQKWTHKDKKCLLKALKRCDRDDIEGIAAYLPDRTLQEVKTYLDMQTKKAKVIDIPTFDVQKKTPIELWLQMAEDLLAEGEDHSKVLGNVCSIIASCEKHEDPQSTRIPDYHAIYVYISNLLLGYSPPKLKALDASVLVELIQDLAHQLTIRDTAQQRQLVESKYRLLTECVEQSNGAGAKSLIQRALQEDLLKDDGTSSHLSELAGQPSSSVGSPRCPAVKIPNKGKGLPKKTSLFSLNPVCIPVRYLRPNLRPDWHESAIPELRYLPPRKPSRRKKKSAGTDDAGSEGDAGKPARKRKSTKKGKFLCNKTKKTPTVLGCTFSTRPLVPEAHGFLHSSQRQAAFHNRAGSSSQGGHQQIPSTRTLDSEAAQQAQETMYFQGNNIALDGSQAPWVTLGVDDTYTDISRQTLPVGKYMPGQSQGSSVAESLPLVIENGSPVIYTNNNTLLSSSTPAGTQPEETTWTSSDQDTPSDVNLCEISVDDQARANGVTKIFKIV